MRPAGQNHPFPRVSVDPGLDFGHLETRGSIGEDQLPVSIFHQLLFNSIKYTLYQCIMYILAISV